MIEVWMCLKGRNCLTVPVYLLEYKIEIKTEL